MNVTIATGPDSWGVWFAHNERQMPWRQFLDEAAEAGYEWIELGPLGYLPTEPATLRRALEQRNLKVCGNFCMQHLEDAAARPALADDLRRTCDQIGPLGARYVVLIDDTYTDLFNGEIQRPPELDDDGWKRLLETCTVAAEQVEAAGLQLVFHPHADSHVEYEAQIERLLRDSDLQLCFDTGHHAYRGGDAVGFFRMHHARIPYLHIKSIDSAKRQRVLRDGIPFATAVGQGMFVEPAAGAVDFEDFRDALREAEFEGFAVVEQDMYPAAPGAPLPIAKRTRSYLREIGIG